LRRARQADMKAASLDWSFVPKNSRRVLSPWRRIHRGWNGPAMFIVENIVWNCERKFEYRGHSSRKCVSSSIISMLQCLQAISARLIVGLVRCKTPKPWLPSLKATIFLCKYTFLIDEGSPLSQKYCAYVLILSPLACAYRELRYKSRWSRIPSEIDLPRTCVIKSCVADMICGCSSKGGFAIIFGMCILAPNFSANFTTQHPHQFVSLGAPLQTHSKFSFAASKRSVTEWLQ